MNDNEVGTYDHKTILFVGIDPKSSTPLIQLRDVDGSLGTPIKLHSLFKFSQPDEVQIDEHKLNKLMEASNATRQG
jgi:hypothetical protein